MMMSARASRRLLCDDYRMQLNFCQDKPLDRCLRLMHYSAHQFAWRKISGAIQASSASDYALHSEGG